MAGIKASSLSINTGKLKVYSLGEFATGKSVFCTTFPTPGYLFDFDGGALTYRDAGDWDFDTFPPTPQGWVAFEKVFRIVKDEVKQGKYKTVILDSSTMMSDVAMARAMQLDPKRTPEGGPVWNVHYQIVKNLMEPKLRDFIAMDCNLVMVGHWKLNIDNKTGEVISADPLLTGQLSERVPGYFDEIYCHFSKRKLGKEEYYIRLTNKGFYKARSRISGKARLLPDELPNTYQAVMEAAEKAMEKMEKEKEKEVKNNA